MPASIRFRLEGVEDLTRKLARLSEGMRGPVLMSSLKKGAEPIRAAAAEKAPRRSGRLSESLIIREGATGLLGTTAEVRVTTTRVAGHGHLVEFGTGPRVTKSGKSTGSMPAQPFMRPAFDENRRRAVEIVRRELGRAVEREARA